MSWGNNAIAAPAAQPAFVVCDAPECKAQAFLIIEHGSGQHNSCCVHAEGVRVVGAVEGAPFNEAARDILLARWDDSKVALEAAKNTEMEVRKAVFAYCFPAPKPGLNRMPLANGFALKADHKINRKIVAAVAEIDAAEDAAAKLGNEATFLFERIIIWKPDFSYSEFKKLDPELPVQASLKKLIEGLIEETPGAPSLTIEEPKAKLNA